MRVRLPPFARSANLPTMEYNRTMDKDLERELLKFLKKANAEPEREPVRVRDYIDWGELGAMTGYSYGGPIVRKLLEKFAGVDSIEELIKKHK